MYCTFASLASCCETAPAILLVGDDDIVGVNHSLVDCDARSVRAIPPLWQLSDRPTEGHKLSSLSSERTIASVATSLLLLKSAILSRSPGGAT